jgi:galactoside O-acetyltransferase
MAYMSREALEKMGFKHLGKNVKVSDKASIYNANQISIGDESRIDDFCTISGKVTIGRNVHIAVYVNVAGGEPGITFEDYSAIAYGSHIFAQSDDYLGYAMTNPTVPDRYKKETKLPIVVGRHTLIGTNCVIFPGVTFGEGTAVGACSLVIRDTAPWSVYTGIPAKKVKERRKDLLLMEEDYIRSGYAPDPL